MFPVKASENLFIFKVLTSFLLNLNFSRKSKSLLFSAFDEFINFNFPVKSKNLSSFHLTNFLVACFTGKNSAKVSPFVLTDIYLPELNVGEKVEKP